MNIFLTFAAHSAVLNINLLMITQYDFEIEKLNFQSHSDARHDQ